MFLKRVYGYSRISTEDQSNFSLDGQDEDIRRFFERQNWELKGIYRDKGQSAKNFYRVEWKRLEQCIKKNHKDIDYLLVTKYDRFSRNVDEALSMLEMLEKRYNIRVISIAENISGIHPDHPSFFLFRTQMLLSAEFEWRIIRDRTINGIHNANLNGRYCSMAPYGYINATDADKKPILQINEERAELVRLAYKEYLRGTGLVPLAKMLRKKGLPLSGNSAMQRLLNNPVYAGLLRVKAYYDEPEKIIEGKHPAIVTKADWYKVQALLAGRSN
ncbi:MAG: recombinase family protein, partial [Flavipsychrobacter sp.]